MSEGGPNRPAPAAREWPIAAVLAGVLAGLAVVAVGHFRTGSVVIGAAVLLAAVLRALLPERRAGLLVVRHRLIDVVVMAALAVGVLVLSVVVPPGR